MHAATRKECASEVSTLLVLVNMAVGYNYSRFNLNTNSISDSIGMMKILMMAAKISSLNQRGLYTNLSLIILQCYVLFAICSSFRDD